MSGNGSTNGSGAAQNGSGSTAVRSLSEAAEKQLQKIVARYPQAKSACLPALYIAQEEFGYVTDEAVYWVADRLGLAPAHVRQVATFYTMFYKKPVGKYHLQICRTLSCAVCGAFDLTKHLQQRFGLKSGEVSADGMWSFEEVECLGSCGSAPMIEINDVYFENLTSEKLDKLLDRIEAELPDLRYSTTRGDLGAGLQGRTKSEVWVRQED